MRIRRQRQRRVQAKDFVKRVYEGAIGLEEYEGYILCYDERERAGSGFMSMGRPLTGITDEPHYLRYHGDPIRLHLRHYFGIVCTQQSVGETLNQWKSQLSGSGLPVGAKYGSQLPRRKVNRSALLLEIRMGKYEFVNGFQTKPIQSTSNQTKPS